MRLNANASASEIDVMTTVQRSTIAMSPDRYCQEVTITSFQPYPLEVAERIAPTIRRGYIGRWDTPEFLETALRLGVTQVDGNHNHADRALVAEAKAQGFRVIGWPTNSQEELDSVLTMNPDLICTDSPPLITELLATAG